MPGNRLSGQWTHFHSPWLKQYRLLFLWPTRASVLLLSAFDLCFDLCFDLQKNSFSQNNASSEMQPMITTSNTGKIPANLKIPPLESSSGKISMTPGTPTPELEAAASPRSPPCLKMRRSHRSSMQTDKIPTLSDLNSISRRLFPKDSNHEDDDNVDSMSIDGILSEALLATPPRGDSSGGKHKMGPPQSRPPSFRKVDTCCHKNNTSSRDAAYFIGPATCRRLWCSLVLLQHRFHRRCTRQQRLRRQRPWQ